MTPEFVRDRLFKPFQTTKATGMGIGAYESFQYVQELGGRVQVDSTPAWARRCGCCCRCSRWPPSAPRPRRSGMTAGKRGSCAMSDKARPLLIVEDDPSLQKQICWAFDQYETLPAADRESALAQLRRHAPPVVTMDLGLPPDPDSVTEGFKLLEQILELAPDTKVIVLTGQNDRANAVRAIGLGAYDFFAKPFEPELLALTIDRAFRLYDLQQENRRLQAMRQPDAFAGLITRDPELLRICRLDREGRRHRRDRPAAGRKRHRQGAAGAGAARPVAAARRALRRDQLRGHSREPAGERAVRLREGRLHRGGAGRRSARSRRPTAAR